MEILSVLHGLSDCVAKMRHHASVFRFFRVKRCGVLVRRRCSRSPPRWRKLIIIFNALVRAGPAMARTHDQLDLPRRWLTPFPSLTFQDSG